MKKIFIEIATAQGCAKCKKANEVITNFLTKIQDVSVREVSIVENPEFAVKHGILSTPAIIINGNLDILGVPSEEELASAIKKHRDKNEN